ncbi:MAG: RagB/SusD family nutrient uptake outer membrane protein, partial [Bacteroidetes bacterium]|nr:RagB/SusD family nutrient uptake outer membrane protein [Bacteroidota bacterium]
DALMAITGCYDQLQSHHIYDSDPWGGGMIRWDCMSDNGYANWKWMQGGAVARGEHSATDNFLYNTWMNLYRGIGRCNTAIKNIGEMDETQIEPATKARVVAEARFIRALLYNLLTMHFRDVPLIKEPLTVEESEVAKTDQSEIVDFIISELNAIVSDLPDPDELLGSEWGKATSGAALSLLARVYLYYGQWANAASTAQQVIDLGAYTLFPDYKNLFQVDNEVNNEVIFPVCFERGPDEDGANFAGYWGANAVVYQRVLENLANEYYCTDGLPIDQSPLYNADNPYENRDPRFDATIVSKNSIWRGGTISWSKINFTGYTMRKWTEEYNSENHFDTPQDFFVIRYGHVLLIRAEALVESGGSETEITGLINQLRDRVGMPHVEDVEGTGLSTDQLRELVRHERRIETAFEGLRYIDLKRWGILGERIQYYNENDVANWPKLPVYNWDDTKFRVWPIPENELDRNKNLVQHIEWQ